MNDERFILVFHPADGEAPLSIRTYHHDDALRRSIELNTRGADTSGGRWAVHELSDEVTP